MSRFDLDVVVRAAEALDVSLPEAEAALESLIPDDEQEGE